MQRNVYFFSEFALENNKGESLVEFPADLHIDKIQISSNKKLMKMSYTVNHEIYPFAIDYNSEVILISNLLSVPVIPLFPQNQNQLFSSPESQEIPWFDIMAPKSDLDLIFEFAYLPHKYNCFSKLFNYVYYQNHSLDVTLKKLALQLRPSGIPLSPDQLITFSFEALAFLRVYCGESPFLFKFLEFLLHDLNNYQLFGPFICISMKAGLGNSIALAPPLSEQILSSRNIEIIESSLFDLGLQLLLVSYNTHHHSSFVQIYQEWGSILVGDFQEKCLKRLEQEYEPMYIEFVQLIYPAFHFAEPKKNPPFDYGDDIPSRAIYGLVPYAIPSCYQWPTELPSSMPRSIMEENDQIEEEPKREEKYRRDERPNKEKKVKGRRRTSPNNQEDISCTGQSINPNEIDQQDEKTLYSQGRKMRGRRAPRNADEKPNRSSRTHRQEPEEEQPQVPPQMFFFGARCRGRGRPFGRGGPPDPRRSRGRRFPGDQGRPMPYPPPPLFDGLPVPFHAHSHPLPHFPAPGCPPDRVWMQTYDQDEDSYTSDYD